MKTKLTIIVLMLFELTSIKLQAQEDSPCYYFGYAYCPKTKVIYISNVVRHTHHYNYNIHYSRQVEHQWEDYVSTYLNEKGVVNSYSSYTYMGGNSDNKCFTYNETANLIKEVKKEYTEKGYKVKEIIDFRYNPED
jgi:hypothetical protein